MNSCFQDYKQLRAINTKFKEKTFNGLNFFYGLLGLLSRNNFEN